MSIVLYKISKVYITECGIKILVVLLAYQPLSYPYGLLGSWLELV